jgi:hypothetical protein
VTQPQPTPIAKPRTPSPEPGARRGLTSAISALIICLVLLLPSCLTTPLPVPPNIEPEARPELITLEPQDGATLIRGSAGAIEPPESVIRVSYGGEPIDSVPPEREELLVGEDGSFQSWLRGDRTSVYYIEAILEDEDRFLVAITGAADDVGAEEADPGPDSDDDGSPDRIDCAPLDETITGRRCF